MFRFNKTIKVASIYNFHLCSVWMLIICVRCKWQYKSKVQTYSTLLVIVTTFDVCRMNWWIQNGKGVTFILLHNFYNYSSPSIFFFLWHIFEFFFFFFLRKFISALLLSTEFLFIKNNCNLDKWLYICIMVSIS